MKINAIVVSSQYPPDFAVLGSSAGEQMDRSCSEVSCHRTSEPVYLGLRQHENVIGYLFEAETDRADA